MNNHTHHPDTGEMILAEPEPIAEITEASVKIAEIEANRDIQLAKINKGLQEELAETDIEVLRAENNALREQLAMLAPEPEPEPEPVVIVADSEPESQEEVPESLPLPELDVQAEEPAPKRAGLGMW
jgi:hypothetical protein